jgi:flagellar hook-associated protein 1 FlgK
MSMSIGLTGLRVAQGAIDLIGTNLANATTDGYHRQEAVISTLDLSGGRALSVGGAKITRARQDVDTLLEREIARQNTSLAQTSEELTSLQTVEATFGDLSTSNLDVAVGTFFDSLRQLSSQPTSRALQEQVVSNGDAMTRQFGDLSTFVNSAQQNAQIQLHDLVGQANDLAAQIAGLNKQVVDMESRGGSTNLLRDNRDAAIAKLAELVDVQVAKAPSDASVTVTAWGSPLVVGIHASHLTEGTTAEGKLGIAIGEGMLQANARGGRIGGVLAVNNDILGGIQAHLDTAAEAIAAGVNRQYAEGVGSAGSFAQLSGSAVASGTLAGWDAGVTAGNLYVRVTDQATGQSTRTAIAIDPATDTAASVCVKLSGVAHLSASVAGYAVGIQAASGYTFDFLPAVAPQPSQTNITGNSVPTIAGQYTGDANDVFTCTVAGTGTVGVAGGLSVQVRDQAGDLIGTLNVGQGYAPGDALDLGNGISIALSDGNLAAGDNFTVQALAHSDETGFLAAAGLNTFFTGRSAADIQVRSELLGDPSLMATNLTDSGEDGGNVARLAEVGDAALASLGNMSPKEYVRQAITQIGQQIATRQARQDNLTSVLKALQTQRDDVSGVDVNEEAAKLLTFERMFQSMAKLITTQDEIMQFLLTQVR